MLKILLGVAIFWVLLFSIQKSIGSYASKKLQEVCTPCRIELGTYWVNPFTGTFTLNDLKFRYEEKDYLEIDWLAHEISGELSFRKLLQGDLFLGKVVIDETDVKLFDGDGAESPPVKSSPLPKFLFALKGLEVKKGKFTYTNRIKGHISVLKIPTVSATLGELGNTPELKDKVVEAVGRGRVEDTGEVVMKIKTYVFAWPPLRVDVDITSTEHDLADLTSFFKPFAGVTLKGRMLEGVGHVELRGDHIKTWIRSRFDNFDVKVDKMYDRSGAGAFFMNLGTAILFDHKNTDKGRANQIRRIEAVRQKGESVPGFILRSLKEAAIKVVRA